MTTSVRLWCACALRESTLRVANGPFRFPSSSHVVLCPVPSVRPPACAAGFVQSGWTCHYSFLFRMLMQVIMWMFFVPCEMGAQTVVHCAVSDAAAKHSGGYFVDCRPAGLRPYAKDSGVARKLWEASERLVKLV